MRRQNTPRAALWPFVLLNLFAACNPSTHRTLEPTLAVLTNLEGITEPCGCTSRPLGGIDRLAQTLAQRRKSAPVAFVAIGDTFFTQAGPAASMRRHEVEKGLTLAKILAQLQPAAVVPGSGDRGSLWPSLLELPTNTRRALHLQAPLGPTDAPTQALGSIAFTLEGQPLALLAAIMPPPNDPKEQMAYTASLTRRARVVRQNGTTLVVLMWPHGLQAARTVLASLADVDVILTGGASILAGDPNAAWAAERLGPATLLQAGARGERLGLLTLHRQKAGGPWTFFDGHNSERIELTSRAERLSQEAAHLPAGPGRTARQQRAAALRTQAAALSSQPPQTSYFTWALEDIIDHDHPPAPWATEALAAFNRSLCDSAQADTAERVCLAGDTPADTYVGNNACLPCHGQVLPVYEKTAHAHAWATLTQAGKQCDLSCVGCHVVGFEQAGGFCRLAEAPKWANVGCESCHGPGAGHAAAPGDRKAWSKHFVRDPPETTCLGCHNDEHSDQFNFSQYRQRILGPGHGMAASP